MSVLYRPIYQEEGKTYDIVTYDGKINESFRELPMTYVKNAIVFFCNLGIDLLNYIKKSLQEEKPKDSVMLELQRLAKNGDGMDSFMVYVEETYSRLMKWYASLYTKHYCGRVTYLTYRKFRNQN
jgi:hypothetical protein